MQLMLIQVSLIGVSRQVDLLFLLLLSGIGLYFGSEDGFFYAVNIDTQKLRWKYRTDGPIYSSPAIAEKMVFFGSTDGTFYALDALTGEEKWKFDTKQSISCNPAIRNNKNLFCIKPEERAGSSKEDNLPKILALGSNNWSENMVS